MIVSTVEICACDIEGHPSELEDDVLIIDFYHFPATEDEKECFDIIDVVVSVINGFHDKSDGNNLKRFYVGDSVLELFDESDVVQSLKEHRKGEQE